MTKIKEKTKLHYNQLGDTPYFVSEVGFGTYRVSSNSEDHQMALAASIKAGINPVKTMVISMMVGWVIGSLMPLSVVERKQK